MSKAVSVGGVGARAARCRGARRRRRLRPRLALHLGEPPGDDRVAGVEREQVLERVPRLVEQPLLHEEVRLLELVGEIDLLALGGRRPRSRRGLRGRGLHRRGGRAAGGGGRAPSRGGGLRARRCGGPRGGRRHDARGRGRRDVVHHLLVGLRGGPRHPDDLVVLSGRLVREGWRERLLVVEDLLIAGPGAGVGERLVLGLLLLRDVGGGEDHLLLVVPVAELDLLGPGDERVEVAQLRVRGRDLRAAARARRARGPAARGRRARGPPRTAARGRLLRPARREVDLAHALVRVGELRLDREHLAEVVERLVVEPVLHVDVGLAEELRDRVRPGRHGTGGATAATGRAAPGGGPAGGARSTWGAARPAPGGGPGRGAGCGGRRRGGASGRGRRGMADRARGVLVVRRELLHLAPDGARVLRAPVLLVDVGELLVDGDRLRPLPEVAERLREELQRLDVLRVGLEAELQLRERALRVALREVDVGELARETEVVRERGDPLRDLQVLVRPAVLLEVVGRPPEALERGRDLARPRVELAELDGGGDVLRIELHHPLQDVGELRPVAGLLVRRRHELELAHGVAHQPELLVQGREPLVHPDVVRVDLHDLLVDRDGLEEEPLLRVRLGDLLEGLGGGLVVALLLEELRDLEETADLPRIVGEDPLVRRDRLVERPLLNELRRLGDDLVLVDSHRAGVRRSRGGARGKRVRRCSARRPPRGPGAR